MQIRPFEGVNLPPISETMYSEKMALSVEVAAFDAAMSEDPSTWWPGDPGLLVAAPAPAPLPPGPPRERASGFGLDSVRRGTDGHNYRVVAGGGKVVGGKVVGGTKLVWELCVPAPSRYHT